MPAEREHCLAAGASDCVAKPVNVEQLLALLQVWLGHGTARRTR
jgi:CheY-like chemotaxis protein